LTQGVKDPLYTILRSKREVTRLQILVEVAEHQPAVRQQEIAAKLGVTPQAISEYIRELVDEGLVAASGRGNYEVTRTGVEWILTNSEALEAYARHIRRDIIQQVSVWAAIASEDLHTGDEVGVYMKGGWLYAGKKAQAATGTVVADAKKDEDVGVARLNGIIEHREGSIRVCKVPRIQQGGSRRVNQRRLTEVLKGVDVVAAVGVEAFIALKTAGRKPDMFYGAREGVIEAAFHGLECVIVIVDEEFTDFLKRLESAGIGYTIHDLIAP